MDFLSGFKFDNPKFESMDDACKWINKNIQYRKIKGYRPPEFTIDKKYGDCGTMSILLMAIVAYQHGNYYSYYVSCKSHIAGESHAIVEYQGEFYDCTKGHKVKIKECDIYERISHNDIMFYAYNR